MCSLRYQLVAISLAVCLSALLQRPNAAQETSESLQTESAQLPNLTLGLPLPNVTLGLPIPVEKARSVNAASMATEGNIPLPYRVVSDGASLAELALPPHLLSGEGDQPQPGRPVQVAPLEPPTPAQPKGRGQDQNSILSLPPPPRPANSPEASGAPQSKPSDLPAPVNLLTPGEATVPTTQVESIPAPQPLSPSPAEARPLDPLDAIPPALLQGKPSPVTSMVPPIPQSIVPLSISPQANVPQADNRYQAASNEEKKERGPYFYSAAPDKLAPSFDALAYPTLYSADAFSPSPIQPLPSNPWIEAAPYRNKSAVPVQRPWVELWRPLYTSGIYPPAKEWFGRYNLVMPHFMVYGDYRTGAAVNRNGNGDFDNLAGRLNLDMDLEITATERLHAFMGPLDRNGDFTRLDFTDQVEFVDRTDIRLDNLFFEGDAGAIWGGMNDQDAPFDLPFTVGFLPVFYQNGIWAADNVIGAAFALPSRNSPLLKWSNYDATFFWASDQVNSDAFPGDNNAAEFFGTAWFIEAYDGFIEADYAFVHDDVGGHRSYHNLSVAYTRRYFYRVSNSIRYITNFGQSLPSEQRTADGHMLLVENSLISKAPNTVVPYMNFFYGQGRTQSLARAAVAGGILNNTGINFETDGLTGYPTLDATGVNATGAALGINMLGADFQHQLILELAALSANGAPQFRNAPGDQYAVGMRYQKPLSNAWIFRTDHMVGLRENAHDLRGSRVELRWKF